MVTNHKALCCLYNGIIEYSIAYNIFDDLAIKDSFNHYYHPDAIDDVKIKILGQHHYQAMESLLNFILLVNNINTSVKNHDLQQMYNNDLPEFIKSELSIQLPSKEFYNACRYFYQLSHKYIPKQIDAFESKDIESLGSISRILDYIMDKYPEEYNCVLSLVKYDIIK